LHPAARTINATVDERPPVVPQVVSIEQTNNHGNGGGCPSHYLELKRVKENQPGVTAGKNKVNRQQRALDNQEQSYSEEHAQKNVKLLFHFLFLSVFILHKL
jgi:hypothetical protein